MKKRPRENEVNYWPGVADCMLGLFMIALILGITTKVIELLPGPGDKVVISQAEYDGFRKDAERLKTIEAELKQETDARKKVESLLVKITQERDDLLNENSKLKASVAMLERQIEYLMIENERLKDENDRIKGENDKPPILVVDATQVSFEKGKAELQTINSRTLREDVFTELLSIVEKYKSVDTIEIIGHTDWSPVGGNSNLDVELLKALKGDQISRLRAGSNADLGLMRAVAVKQEWDKWRKNRLPRNIQVRCYSAAQGIDPPAINGKIYANQARRIEIRFTQLKK
jgi:flagellar motor protein MotB